MESCMVGYSSHNGSGEHPHPTSLGDGKGRRKTDRIANQRSWHQSSKSLKVSPFDMCLHLKGGI